MFLSSIYIHLVDGGITDNLELRAIHEVSAVSGGAKSLFQLLAENHQSG